MKIINTRVLSSVLPTCRQITPSDYVSKIANYKIPLFMFLIMSCWLLFSVCPANATLLKGQVDEYPFYTQEATEDDDIELKIEWGNWHRRLQLAVYKKLRAALSRATYKISGSVSYNYWVTSSGRIKLEFFNDRSIGLKGLIWDTFYELQGDPILRFPSNTRKEIVMSPEPETYAVNTNGEPGSFEGTNSNEVETVK